MVITECKLSRPIYLSVYIYLFHRNNKAKMKKTNGTMEPDDNGKQHLQPHNKKLCIELLPKRSTSICCSVTVQISCHLRYTAMRQMAHHELHNCNILYSSFRQGVLSFDFNHVSTPNGTVSAHQRNENTLLLLDSLLYKVYEKRPVTHSASQI